MESLTEFIKFLQGCITPVAMISGVGLLLLTITNRMGRVVDRIRLIVRELEGIDDSQESLKATKTYEVVIFYKRAKLLRNSIASIMVGMISSCLLIPLLFIMTFTSMDLRMMGYALFLISITSMLVSFLYFFRDILMSLHGIKLEAINYIECQKKK
jgi:hypothetical protein